jgi:hypothetical protein
MARGLRLKYVTNIFAVSIDLCASAACVLAMFELTCKEHISVCAKGKRQRVVQRTAAGYGVTNAGEVGNRSDWFVLHMLART